MKIILIGPPGSGKGTVAEKLVQDFDLKHISSGDIFREEIKKKTELGMKAKEYMDKGVLVPDEVTIPMVKNHIEDGVLLDGYPRTLPQAESLEDAGIDLVIYLAVPEDVIVERLSNRRICSRCGATYNLKFMKPEKEGACDKCGGELIQREDDKPEAIRKRVQVFHKQTEPLLKYYREEGLLRKVDGARPPEEVYSDVRKLTESLRP